MGCVERVCPRLYRTRPSPTYYVIDVWRIISDAPIIPDPINPTIPHKALKYRGAVQHNPNPSARADSTAGRHDGSALFIVNRWAFSSARASSGMMTQKGSLRKGVIRYEDPEG